MMIMRNGSVPRIDHISPKGDLIRLVKYLSSQDDKGLALEGLNDGLKALYRLNANRVDRAIKITINNSIHNIGKKYDKCQFHVPQEVEDWSQKMRKTKALILLGRSGTGKTELAKALFDRPLLVRDINQLKGLDSQHDGIIFDDMVLDYRREAIIHLMDLENRSGVNVKFGTEEIEAEMPRVFTSNRDINDFLGLPEWEQIPEELSRRITVVVVDDDMRMLKKK